MPDKKYLIEIPGMPEGSGVWDADKWERNKDLFMEDYPDANVFELGEYDADDAKETDQIMLDLGNEDMSGFWDNAKWERNKDLLMEDYPEAKVSRVRYVDYWGQKAEENRAQRALLQQPNEERNARLAEIGYYDDITGGQVDFSLTAPSTIGLKPLSSAVEESATGETTYHDPRVKEFFANDSAETDRQAEIARLDAEYDANPSVIAQREWEAKVLEERKAYAGNLEREIRRNMESDVDVVKASRGGAAKRGFDPPEGSQMSYLLDRIAGDEAGSGSAENEKLENYTTALKFMEKAKIARDVAGKGFGGAVVDWTKEGMMDLATQDDVEAYNEIGNILTRLEKKVGSLKSENLTEEVFDKYLTKSEQALIKSFYEYNAAMAEAGQDMSRAYKGGKIFAESVPFMLEFIATGGFYRGAGRAATSWMGKGFAKWIAKSAAKSTARAAKVATTKIVSGAVKAGFGTLGRTIASSGTYDRMAEASIEIDEDGHLNRAKESAIAFADMYVENLSEISGGLIGKGLGLLGKGASVVGKSAGKLIANTPLSKVGTLLADNAFMQSLSKFGNGLKAFMPKLEALGFHGLPEEVGEEFIGNTIREIAGIQPGALKEMVSDDNFGAMLIGFAPMTMLGVAGGIYNLGVVNAKAAQLGRDLREKFGSAYTEEELDHMMGVIQNAQTAEDIQKALKPMAMAAVDSFERGVITQEQMTEQIEMLYQYGGFMAQNNALLFGKKAQDRQMMDAKREEFTGQYGRFWQEDESETVQVATLNNGSTVFVTSVPAEDGKITTIDVATGKKGFANVSDIATQEVEDEQIPSTNSMTMDAFLNGQIATQRKTAEETRMNNERNAQIEALRAQIAPGTKINLGTEGSPVIVFATGTNKNGVVVVNETGMQSTLGWEQAAYALGQPIKVETDQQKLDAEIADRLQRMAERRMRRAVTPATEATAEAADEAAEVVAQEQQNIPLREDGTVDEALFWTQDPEGYVKWNDEQNKDGGQDSLRQIAISKQELFGMLNEAATGQNTSNPTMRKAAEKQVAAIAEKIARLEALEMSYADALAEEKEAVKQTQATPTATMSEEQLEQMDAQYQGILGKTRIQSERVRVMQEYLNKLAEDSIPAILLTMENYAEVMEQEGCADFLIESVREQVDAGEIVSGFMANGKVFLMAEGLASIESGRVTYVHERQHTFNRANPQLVQRVAEALGSKEVALSIVESFVGKKGTKAYESLDLNGLADEIIAFSMEIVYTTEEFSVDLQSKGIPSEVISIITEIDNEQRQDQSLSHARRRSRRNSHDDVSGSGNMREDGRDLGQISGGVLVEETTRSSETGKRGAQTGSTGEGTEVISEEQLNAPSSGTAQQITAADGEVLADTDGKGGVRFSIRTWNEGGRDYLAAWLANDITLTDEEKTDILSRMDEFYKNALLYSDTYAPFGTWSDAGVRYDNNGNPLMSVIKANGDYAMNLDFSLVCKKRRPLNRLLRTLVNRNAFATYTLRERELAEINWILQEHGFEVACALCFVDSKRYRVTGVADVFAALYNRLVKSLAPEGVQIAHFNYNENPNVEVVENGLDTISDDQLNWDRFDRMLSAYKPGSVEHKVAQYLREHPEARKLVDATDFIEAEGFESVKENNPDLLKFYNMKKGTGGPKASFGDVQYLNDILKKEKSFDAEKAYAVGGVRLQSFSDFVPHMYFDYMQLFAELAAKRLPLHAYTKEVLFAKIFGLTGAKINMSLVPAVVEGGIAPGLDAEGNYAWADPVTDVEGNVIQQGQSFPYDEAMAIQQAEGYSKNCGVIAVGISDAHIEKMLDDPNIPFIIPYHKSSLNAIVARMTNIDQYKDYTNVQNTRKASGSKLDKGTKDFNFNEYLHGLGESGTPQQAAQAYLDWCRENNYKPKFSQFAYHPNYYKLLQDFNTIDLATGEYAPQGAVTMTFPTEESAFGNVETLIQQGLQEDAELEEKMEQEIDGIADQVLSRLEEISKEPKMSEKQQARKMAELADERMAKIKERASGPVDIISEAEKAVDNELRMRVIGEVGARRMDDAVEATTMMDNLAVAKEMEEAGKDAKAIKMATGWERGADNLWRYEMEDFEFIGKPGRKKTFKLSDLIADQALFTAYPELKDIKVKYTKLAKGRGGEVATEKGKTVIRINEDQYRAQNPVVLKAAEEFAKNHPEIAELVSRGRMYAMTAEQREIYLNELRKPFIENEPYINEFGGKGTLVHEIQHVIQDIENFAQGGNSAMVDTSDPAVRNEVETLQRVLGIEIENANELVPVLKDIFTRGRMAELSGDRQTALALKAEWNKKKAEWDNHSANINAIKKDLRKFKTLGLEGYRKLAGEVESRNAEARMNMSYNERRNSLLSETEDVAREDQIFLRDNLMMKSDEYKASVSFRITPEQDEMDAISATAIVRGNYLKAPNGADTNLTPEQWAMVRTKNFKNWFGDWENDPENASKVVDENGEPKVVFHGSNWRPILEDPGKATFKMRSGLMGRGAYFTDNFTNAADYAREKYEWENYKEVDEDFVSDNGYVTEAFLNIRNEDNIREYYGETYYLATDPSQIKSATGNTGEFSTEDKDIRYRVMSDVNTNPTEAQKKAGNYKMGHIRLDGYNITIENPKGSVRRGTDSKGNAWENTLNNDYGYIRGTEGVDGDHIDVYLSDNPTEGNVFVIDQVNPETREFDEHKVMYGFNSAEEAREAYLANFSEGWNGLGTITEVSKDEFKKWINSSHRKTKPFSEYKSVRANELQATDESDLRYRVVTNQETLDRLNSESTIKVYRAMQLIDGKLYPPMSAKVDGELRQPIELGQWEEAEERPDLVDEKGRFKLDKGNKSSLKARYNPYFHTSPTPLNDQFSSAQTRPELVTVEVEVPESELTSGYKAEKAKDSVGKMEWKAGVVQSKLSGTRTVILSRWDKPVRIVPESEVADVIVDMFEGKDITMPSNVVTPSLRAELEKRGVPFVETDNQGNPVEEVSFRVTGTPTDELVTNGLRLTPAQTAEVAANIFAALPEESRKKITDGLNGNILGLKDAILQIPTSLASKENWNEEDKQIAEVVRGVVQDLVDANPTTRPLTTKEALWMLYDSTNAVKDLVDAASRAFVAYNLGFDEASMRRKSEVDDYVRFRTANNGAIDAATDMYNYETSLWTERLKESWLDMNQSVVSLQKAMSEASGMPIEPWENLEFALNRLSSKSYADKKKYLRDFLMPMWDTILDIVKHDHVSIEEIERYMMLKHGLERNRKFASRDARDYYRTMYDLVAERMKNQSHAQKVVALSEAKNALAAIDAQIAVASSSQLPRLNEARAKAQYDVEVADLVLRGDETQNEAELQAYYDAIDNEADPKYREFREKDYGGLTSMFVDTTEVKRSDYKSEEAYQQAVLAATAPKFDKVADMEAEAEQEVDAFENKVYMYRTLWDKVNAATKETLRHQYESGMITLEQYEAVRDMFEFYVPLRGFADNTAEDMYSYYMSNSSNGFAMPILGAKGRKTKAESPLGWIGTMAESAIQADNKNEAKMCLYYMTLRRPDQSLLTITETWYEYTGQKDANGKKIFKAAYPPATDRALNADELRQHMEDWEDDMKKKQSRGEAYKGSQKVDLKGSVVFQDVKEEKEHIVRVKVAGKDYSILINGNPRAAQAINGLLNPDANEGPAAHWIGKMRRNLSALLTSYSPLFWVANYQRDLLSSVQRVSEADGWDAAMKYLANRRKAWRVASYIYKYDAGTLGDSYYEKLYKEFAENGGITGYTALTTNKEYESLLEKYANNVDKHVLNAVKGVWDKFMGFGEAIEQVSRFAAFITAREEGKSIEEAVNAAKEVSVNFNRKGSAKPISLDELDKLRTKDGKKLNGAQRIAALTLSAMPGPMKFCFYFVNASIQALSSSAKLAKKSPGKATTWVGMYMGTSIALAMLNYLLSDDDDDEYLDLPDYLRHSTILIKVADGYYFKWSIPQEMRPFYAWADILVRKMMGKMPHKSGKDVGKEMALAASQWLPVNPFDAEDPLLSIIPDFGSPLAEIVANTNAFGGKIYDDMSFKPEGVVKEIPAYRKATEKTGAIYVDIAEFLNDVSGGDEVTKGKININPAVMEHLIEGYGGGIYDFAKMMVSIPSMIFSDDPVQIKEIPFVNKLILSVDETNMYSHTNEAFYHYRNVADNAKRVENEYRESDDPSRADDYQKEEDWRIYLLYKEYEADFKDVKERLDNAVDKEEEALLKQEQNVLREMFLDDIAKGDIPEITFQIREEVKRIDKEVKKVMKPVTEANKERLERKRTGDVDGMLRAIERRDSLKDTPEYERAEEINEDLKVIKKQLKELGSVTRGPQRDSVIGELEKNYNALLEKMQ